MFEAFLALDVELMEDVERDKNRKGASDPSF
jgi:hypothetical protein